MSASPICPTSIAGSADVMALPRRTCERGSARSRAGKHAGWADLPFQEGLVSSSIESVCAIGEFSKGSQGAASYASRLALDEGPPQPDYASALRKHRRLDDGRCFSARLAREL